MILILPTIRTTFAFCSASTRQLVFIKNYIFGLIFRRLKKIRGDRHSWPIKF